MICPRAQDILEADIIYMGSFYCILLIYLHLCDIIEERPYNATGVLL